MQARYYDPVIGRFYSNDPVGYISGNVHSFGRYTYVNNNPYKYTDPDGQFGLLLNLNRRDMSTQQSLLVAGISNSALKAGAISAVTVSSVALTARAIPVLVSTPQAAQINATMTSASTKVNAAVLSASISVSNQLNKASSIVGNFVNSVKETANNMATKMITSPLVTNPSTVPAGVDFLQGAIEPQMPATSLPNAAGTFVRTVIDDK